MTLTVKLLLSFLIPDAATLKSWRSISVNIVSWKYIIIDENIKDIVKG